jgi:hypothetical protein
VSHTSCFLSELLVTIADPSLLPLTPLHPHKLLARMALPRHSGVYVLGSFARHVTIYSQQMRALNLVDALSRTGEITRGVEVTVVGGGAAGVTAAAAAVLRGARVTIVEKGSHYFPIQRNAATRYLHPHVYDWPLYEGWPNRADFPFLAWDAGDAPVVFKQLQDGWNALWAGCPKGVRPEERLGTEFTGLAYDIGRRRWVLTLTPTGGGDPTTHEAQIVILALGFGREAESPTLQKYWDASPLDSDAEPRLTWLVSGAGDGGLTDLMRLCIRDFRHDQYVGRFAGDARTTRLLREVLVGPLPAAGSVRAAFEGLYRQLEPGARIRADERRDDTSVAFNAPPDYLEDPGSAVLNRFIVFQLEQLGAFRLLPGRLRLPVPPPGPDGRFTVELAVGEGEAWEKHVFDRVVLRHGPVPALSGDRFLDLRDAIEELRAAWKAEPQGSDRTRVQLWDPADFDPAGAWWQAEEEGEPDAGADLRFFTLTSTSPREPVALPKLVKVAAETFKGEIKQVFGRRQVEPDLAMSFAATNVNDALASSTAFDRTVGFLCRSDVAVIDVTGFEPGVMLFLGIRSAARRGVTLVTTNDEVSSGAWARLPFNVRELFPLGVKQRVYNIGSPEHPTNVMGRALAQSIGRYRSLPDYLDVPAYEAVRRGEAAPGVDSQSILWLCSFAEEYRACEAYIQNGFSTAYGYDSTGRAQCRLERVTEIGSAQLVTQRLYGAIRRTGLCLVDWTLWSPNVFFELGVRLAVSSMGPVCLLDDEVACAASDHGAAPSAALQAQRRVLRRLFPPLEYRCESDDDGWFTEIQERFREMRDHKASGGGGVRPSFGAFPYDHVYRLVGSQVPLDHEAGALPVPRFLAAAADAVIGASSTRDTSLPVLYADVNSDLDLQARTAGRELLVAAWLYLRHYYAAAEPASRRERHREYQDLSVRLADLLERDGQQHTELCRAVEAELGMLDSVPMDGSGR